MLKTTLTKENVVTATNGKYVPICQAGHGVSGEVWFCLPQEILKFTSPLTVATVKPHIVCVKIFSDTRGRSAAFGSSPSTLHTELEILKQLRFTTGSLKSRFTEILEHSEEADGSTGNCYAMRAVNGFQLTKLQQVIHSTKKIAPVELIYHVFLQLHEAVQFIQSSPPHSSKMTKGDFPVLNCMVDPVTQGTPEFPNLVLIDFGGAKLDADENSRRLELNGCYNMIQFMAMINHRCKQTASVFNSAEGAAPQCDHEPEFDDFMNVLERIKNTQSSHWKKETSSSDASAEAEMKAELDRWVTILTIGRDNASPETRQTIEALCQHASVANGGSGSRFPTDQQIQAALPAGQAS